MNEAPEVLGTAGAFSRLATRNETTRFSSLTGSRASCQRDPRSAVRSVALRSVSLRVAERCVSVCSARLRASLLFDDFDLERGRERVMELDRHFHGAEALDRLRELDATPIELDADAL